MRIIRNLLKPLSFLPAIFIMYLIFSFSAQDGVTSAELSYKVSYKIVEIGGEILGAELEPWEIDSLANRFHGPVRKIAHMTEYFALAVAISFPLYVYGLRGILLMLVAGIFCVGFACADEYHQAYVAGRGPSKKDVAIDSFGVFWGIILVRIVGWTGRKTIFRPFCKKKNRKKETTVQQPMMHPPYQQPMMYPPCQQPQPFDGYHSGPSASVYPPAPGPYAAPASSANMRYFGSSGNADPYAPYQQTYAQAHHAPVHNTSVHNASVHNASYSDSLSEDMSLKKLMHDLKDQKKAAYAGMKQARKPSVDGTDLPDENDMPDI